MAKNEFIVKEENLPSGTAFMMREIIDFQTSVGPKKGPGGWNPPHYPSPPYLISIRTLHKLDIKDPADLVIAFTMTEYQAYLELSVLVSDAEKIVFETTPQDVKPKLGHRVALTLDKDTAEKMSQHFQEGNSLSLLAASYTAPALLEYSVRNKHQPL
jgi:hypothetical protein